MFVRQGQMLGRPGLGLVQSIVHGVNVSFIVLFPGLSVEALECKLAQPGLKGIVLRTYGAGNAPTDERFIELIRRRIAEGLVVVNISQCDAGGVMPHRYAAGDEAFFTDTGSGQGGFAF